VQNKTARSSEEPNRNGVRKRERKNRESKRRTERKGEGDLDGSEGRKKEEKELPVRRRRACV